MKLGNVGHFSSFLDLKLPSSLSDDIVEKLQLKNPEGLENYTYTWILEKTHIDLLNASIDKEN